MIIYTDSGSYDLDLVCKLSLDKVLQEGKRSGFLMTLVFTDGQTLVLDEKLGSQTDKDAFNEVFTYFLDK